MCDDNSVQNTRSNKTCVLTVGVQKEAKLFGKGLDVVAIKIQTMNIKLQRKSYPSH